MSDNLRSPYFYQWDGDSRPFQKPPLPPTPTKQAPLGARGVGHIRMASMELSDSYSLDSASGDSMDGGNSQSTVETGTTTQSNVPPSPWISRTPSVSFDSDHLPSEISEYYERRQSVKRQFPPLPPIPVTIREKKEPVAQLPMIDETTMFTTANTSQEDVESFSDFDWSRPQYTHLKHKECPSAMCWGLFIVSILAVPFSLCIYLGWMDRALGEVPRGWKIAHLASFSVMTVCGVIGAIAGLAVGLS